MMRVKRTLSEQSVSCQPL